MTEAFCDIFFETSFSLLFPVLDKLLFAQTVSLAYQSADDVPSSPAHVLARACVLAALSVASRLDLRATPIDADICAAKAKSLLQHMNGYESLISLQTILLLQRHETFTGRWQDAEAFHSLACRMVCGLGGHIHSQLNLQNKEPSPIERESHLIRTLFWVCYILDKDMSLRSGRPPLLCEEICDLIQEENIRKWHSAQLEPYDNLGSGDDICGELVSHATWKLSLGRLKETTYRLLYSAHAIKSTDSEHLLHIRQLDAELELWRSSIPTSLRPILSVSPSCSLLAVEPSTPHSMLRLNLQLEYHYMMTAIHATVRRCRNNGGEPHNIPDDLHSVLHSSTDLSLEASRSTLLILKKFATTQLTEGSQYVLLHPRNHFHNDANDSDSHSIFFPVVAAMSLFTNILVHPAEVETPSDADLLVSAAVILQAIPTTYAPSQNESEYVDQMIKFVHELARLGALAIAKATKHDMAPVLS
ncbi:unnamed protein product [Clonostachys rosea]|uniref:Xylanolytic transcriptional activator regulatory domain-containing protein n=1 Tax=Bionectria ochroleuca TaxID=29856 RepID=A0ABY6UHM9_BIOOC|nr:unnamed protein product [Clonostachys rosea]